MTDTDPALRALLRDILTDFDREPTEEYLDTVMSRLAAAAEAAPPEGTRLVLMSEDLALTLGADRVEWNEPDEHGWYTPTLYKASAEAAPLDVDAIAEKVKALDPTFSGGYGSAISDVLDILAATSREDGL